MGYRISYENTFTKVEAKERNKNHAGKHLLMAILVLVIVSITVFVADNRGLLQYILPGDPGTTEAALESMITSIRDGVTVEDAAHAFCVEIFKNALMGG